MADFTLDLATNRYKVHLNPLQGEECLFCGLSENSISYIHRLFKVIRNSWGVKRFEQ